MHIFDARPISGVHNVTISGRASERGLHVLEKSAVTGVKGLFSNAGHLPGYLYMSGGKRWAPEKGHGRGVHHPSEVMIGCGSRPKAVTDTIEGVRSGRKLLRIISVS